MRATIVFPPSICLPNQMYYSLPMLAGALRRGGHDARVVDLNLLAADLLLTDERADRYLELGRGQVERLKRAGDVAGWRFLDDSLRRVESDVRRSPESKAVLRDPERYFEPTRFRNAFWNVVEALGFFYQLDPIISPHRDRFAADMIEHQRRDPWSVMTDLVDERLLDEVLDGDPGMVGISLAFPEQAVEAVRLARRVKTRSKGVHVCLGGPLVSLYPDKWLGDGWIFDFVDSVCIGDGETTIVELCDAIADDVSLDGVTNLATRDRHGRVRRPDETNLSAMDDLPLPDFDSFDMSTYFTPRPIYPFMTSRGCYWGRCTFCSIGWRENFRMASVEKIETDLAHLTSRYGARYLQVNDSSLPPRSARRLADAVAASGRSVDWVAGMKFDRALLDADYCRSLRRGGARSLMLGFESASQRVIDRMDKGFQVEQVPRMLANLREAGISAELLWFVGFPGEQPREALDTTRFLHSHRHLFGLSAFVSEYQLHPDTMIYERPREFGVTVTGQHNGVCSYRVDSGLQMDDLVELKRELDPTNNRTLICNGSHLLHLAETGLDLSRLARPGPDPERVASVVESPTRGTGQPVAVFDDDFGFRSQLERRADAILEEWRRVPTRDLMRWPQPGAYNGDWRVFGLRVAGAPPSDEIRRRFPATLGALDLVPGLFNAGFSVLGPSTTLPPHRGELGEVLRCHLALEIPPGCGIRVAGRVYEWSPGRTFVFDDTALHDAWNHSDRPKVVLMIDFDKPWSRGEDETETQREAEFYRELFPTWG